MPSSVEEVRQFWENNPLWVGESDYSPGTLQFFEEHRQVYIDDCFAGEIDPRLFPIDKTNSFVLDLGCGPGFWTIEFGQRGFLELASADLTFSALELTSQRCKLYGYKTKLSQQNAETMGFEDNSFTHVNCLGVIHHTPDTNASISEIARVLKTDGTANISVYYRNFILRAWPILRWVGKILSIFGAGMKGRGRDDIFSEDDVDAIVKLYDGKDNPIGKSYSQDEFMRILEPYFEIQDTWTYFFPARALPIKLPHFVHKFFDRYLGFMICVRVKK